MERHGALEEPFVYLQKIGVKTRPKMLSYGVSNEMLLFWDSGENVGKIQRLIDDRLTALSQALADNDFAGFKKELEAGSPSAGLYLGPGVRGRSGRNTTIFTAALEFPTCVLPKPCWTGALHSRISMRITASRWPETTAFRKSGSC